MVAFDTYWNNALNLKKPHSELFMQPHQNASANGALVLLDLIL